MKVLDLFSGIGGFSLGLERAGMETVAFCEMDPFCRQVLARHWPHIPIYTDIRRLTKEDVANDTTDDIGVICGGYPCQPYSVAGPRRGELDHRHLWPEMYRLIKGIRPQWVIAENVAGHVNMGLDDVLHDLENANYQCWTFIIPAIAVGGLHRRNRLERTITRVSAQRTLDALGRYYWNPCRDVDAPGAAVTVGDLVTQGYLGSVPPTHNGESFALAMTPAALSVILPSIDPVTGDPVRVTAHPALLRGDQQSWRYRTLFEEVNCE